MTVAVAGNNAASLVYTPALDGLRCIAIALVIASHIVHPAHFGGDVGVDVFFVLSGYLITTILMSDLAASTLSLVTFSARRMIRLAPALILTVVLTIPIALLISSQHRDVILGGIFALLYLTPITSIIVPTPGSWFGHTWTLGLEEYFYLFWPVVLGWMFRRRLSWRTAASLALGAGILLLVAKNIIDPSHTASAGQFRVGGIAIGCALAIFLRHHSWRHPLRGLVTSGVAIIVAGAFLANDGLLSTAGYLIADFGAVIAITGVMSGDRSMLRRFLETRPLVYLGRISYEIYLVHYPVLIGATLALGVTPAVVAWWAVPLAIVIGAGMHAGFLPLQRMLRDRLVRTDRLARTPERS